MLEALEFDVSVELRGMEVAMSEQLLHVAQAGAATQEMRRAAVAESVHTGFHFGLQSVVADALRDHLIREPATGD